MLKILDVKGGVDDKEEVILWGLINLDIEVKK